ncbi:hypothetical protein [Aestuariispira insulae]|uniref:Penicillin-insensitive murein endopeptidase n=1 Tax=Aestuariispira insulae TaxID=1461337 RepID=A0A3D9H5X1_9PROT|nr:hypothetical protein [Aestuariispira insulae]RED44839.1 hypothetical protein DFP90_11344 [Aestuariispira insulae]
MKWLGFLIHAAVFLALTLLTQIGGLVYLLAWALTFNIRRFLPRQFWRVVLFLTLYVGALFAAREMAPVYGRVPLPCLEGEQREFRMQSPIYCLLNRNYVRPEVRSMILDLAIHMNREFPGTITLGLDANFPFFDGFPLFPHLSHDDGRKLDLAFYYRDDKGYLPGVSASPVGYWAFAAAPDHLLCPAQRPWHSPRWDMAWFQQYNRGLSVDLDRTKAALNWLLAAGEAHGLEKIFLEPSLQKKWGISGGVVRFQGCNAARHDDHIHLQLGD